jgi:hypothetical protein
MKHHESARGAIEEIDDVIETRRHVVNVLAIERRDERFVYALDDLRGEQIGRMLDVLDRLDMIVGAVRLLEQIVDQPCTGCQMASQLVEQLKKLFVARHQAFKHVGQE